MQNAVIKQMESGLSEEKITLLKNTVAKGATNDELQLFLHICNKTGLDPFVKQIWAIKRGNAMTFQTSIDGLRLTADRTKRYSPGREPIFEKDAQGKLVSATAFVKKQTSDGTWHEVAAKVFLCEYYKKGTFWDTMSHTMLAKVAESHALRKAFPAEMSGLYSDDEMDQATVDVKNEPKTPIAVADSKRLEIIEVTPEPKKEKVALPAKPLNEVQIKWTKEELKKIGVTYDDVQQELGCPNLEEILQSNLKGFMNQIKSKWSRAAHAVN